MSHIDADLIRRLCSRPVRPGAALEAAVRLGPLASWWLRTEVLEQAARLQPAFAACWTPPRLTPVLGGCPVAVVLARPREYPLLRPAFLFPLRWLRDREDDPLLPRALHELARQVAAALSGEPRVGTAWGLQPHFGPGSEALDLRELDFTFASGWAPLAGGLLLAADGLLPDPHTWASGAWDPYTGVAAVEGLAAKLQLAREHRARSFFLPLGQRSEAQGWTDAAAGAPLELGWLYPSERPSPRQVLRAYLAGLGLPPGREEPFEDRCRYHALQPRDHPATERYYAEALLPDVAAGLRRQVESDWPGWRPACLVTVLSASRALVRLAAEALAVREVVLLHTEDDPSEHILAARDEVCADLQARGTSCRPVAFREEGLAAMIQALRAQLTAALGAVSPEEVVFDMTPGKKNMTLALSRAAPQGSWLIYCRHEQLPDGRPRPGSERIERWSAKEEAAASRETCR
jgi:hypothetical protein